MAGSGNKLVGVDPALFRAGAHRLLQRRTASEAGAGKRASSSTRSGRGRDCATSARRALADRIAIWPNISPRPSRQVWPATSSSTAPEAMKYTFRTGAVLAEDEVPRIDASAS